jgi:hypothetical protein
LKTDLKVGLKTAQDPTASGGMITQELQLLFVAKPPKA